MFIKKISIRAAECIAAFALLLCGVSGYAQYNPATDPLTPCDLKASEIPGKEFRLSKVDDRLNGDAKWVAETTRRIGQALQIVKDVWPGQKGFEASYFRVLAKDPKESVGAYHLQATMFTYRCHHFIDPSTHKYITNDEIKKPNLDSTVDTGSQNFVLQIGINSKQTLFNRELHARVDGHERTFLETFPLVTERDGFKIFGVDRLGGPKVLYIGRPGEVVYETITREQYVLATMDYLDTFYGPSGKPGTGSFRGSFPVEDIEWERADMKAYLQSPRSELDKPAYTKRAIGYWRGKNDQPNVPYFEESLIPGVSEVLTLRKGYFDETKPNYIPQLITMRWTMPSVTEGSRVMEQRFLANFPARRLQMLLDK
jgi:hypothetical protein